MYGGSNFVPLSLGKLTFLTPYCYTLSHPENDCDVTERAQGYTLQDASFMRQSRCSFLNAWENTQVERAMTSAFVWNTHWRHGRSRGETKYRWYSLPNGGSNLASMSTLCPVGILVPFTCLFFTSTSRSMEYQSPSPSCRNDKNNRFTCFLQKMSDLWGKCL